MMNRLFFLPGLLLLGLAQGPLPAPPSPAEKALAFIRSLNPEQKGKALIPFPETTRYIWSFLPENAVLRYGIQVRELEAGQRQHLDELLRVCLSESGYGKVKTIINLETVLRQLNPANTTRDPGLYRVSIYGMPGTDSTWGLKYEGHHLSLNFTLVNNHISFAPFFFGANPAEVRTEGPLKGTRVMKEEEDLAYELLGMLNETQRKKAVFSSRAFEEIVSSDASETGPLSPAGLPAKEMNTAQLIQLNKLIGAYLGSMPPRLAAMRMKKINAEHMEETRFGWAGDTARGEPHYYRIQGKTFLIEFDNVQNNANHIHAVWRDFYGDFGRDLLREHYHNSPDHRH